MKANMKRRGATLEERTRRIFRRSLIAGTAGMHTQGQNQAKDTLKRFLEKSAGQYEMCSTLKRWFRLLCYVQNAYRRRKSIKLTKRELLDKLWDDFIEKHQIAITKRTTLQYQLKQTNNK